jgi:hypothetical protein
MFASATNVTSHMGLLPELERAWITIDHQLFLWDYIEGCEARLLDVPLADVRRIGRAS